jgi:hypothetical protein
MNEPYYRKRWFQITLLVCGTIAIVYGMIYVDVIMRARSAYLEGEKYWSWHEHPEQKQAYFEQDLAKQLADIKFQFDKGKLTKDQYDQNVQLATFNARESLNESSIKYAYVWYQTVVELFTPPESRWVTRARQKMPIAKEKWKEELRAKKIPFEDYMIE